MARPVITISAAEIMDELANAMAKSDAPSEARTTKEIVASSGMSYVKVMQALHAFAAQKRLGVFKVPRLALDGSQHMVTGYTILAKPKK